MTYGEREARLTGDEGGVLAAVRDHFRTVRKMLAACIEGIETFRATADARPA
jgi:hypothetical protein